MFWTWDFGNGQTSNLQNPSITYTAPGSYTVTLIARNRSGSNAMRKNGYITVYPFPTPKFTSDLTLACAPASVQFVDQSTPGQGSITNWKWDLGDGTTSNQQNPSHAYTQTGYYNISLTVTNSGGCTNSGAINRYLRVINGIQPNFQWNQASAACTAPYAINFINQTAGPGNLSFNWSLGSGVTPANSTDTNPTNVTYPANGNYSVTLQVSSSLGCTASIQQTLPFNGTNATITGPTTVCVNTPAVFSNGSAPPPSFNTWDFGDGTGNDSSSATKTWNAVGSYNVKLVNHYPTCADSSIENVQVVTEAVAAFTSDRTGSCMAPLAVQFTDQTTGSTSWQWDFGDGSTSNQQNPTHTYNSTGSYTVTLTATGPGGCPNTLVKNAYIQIQQPSVAINNPNSISVCINGGGINPRINPTFTLNAPGGVSAYNWSAPGSDQGSSNIASPTFTYSTTGTFPLSLTVTTPDGCTSPAANATVLAGSPTPAAFTVMPATICGSNTVTFATTSMPADHYAWIFGDGTKSGTLPTPVVTHTYTKISPPPITVFLTLINNGCQTVASMPITINPPIPNFGFKMVGCPYTVGFIDSSLTDNSPTMTYHWVFGDGSPTLTTTGPQPVPPALVTTHPYSGPGTYTVTLTVTDGVTCPPAPISKTITLAAVTPGFTAPPAACANQPFTLTDATTITPPTPGFIRAYTWQIGPNTISNGASYTTSLPVVGAYPIILTDTDVNGCFYSSAPSTIQITGPNPKFTVLPAGGGCLNSPVVFTDQSTGFPGVGGPPPIPPSTISKWSWNFGDGSPAQNIPAPPFTHQYTDTGTYNVILTVTDNTNCSASDTVPVLVASPIANFGSPDSFYCANTPLTFIDSSRGYGLTDSWNFGDGSSVSLTPTHSFANSGTTYKVTLTVTDMNNCTAGITKPVFIQNPIAAFNIYDTTTICVPFQTLFAAHGKYYDSLYWNFGDGATSTLDSTSHFYNTTDTFTAKLFVEGPGGCFDSMSRSILVLNPFTTTSFTFSPIKACDSVPAQFDITPPGYTRFTTYFGDNTADSSQNTRPFHEYRNPMSVTPFLLLNDVGGCFVQYTASKSVTVLGSEPFFSIDTHAFCDSSFANFTDFSISNDGLVSETYTFGDGSPSQSQKPGTGAFNVSNNYLIPGTWLATLTISTNSGCTETYTDTVRVHQTPHPVITVGSAYCTGLVQFQGNLTGPETPMDTVHWAWNFGNGQTSAIQDPAANMAPGTFTVGLVASIPYGCADTTASTITIFPLPQIKGPREITTPVGIPVTIPFTYSDSLVSYVWTPAIHLDCPTCPNPTATLIFSTEYVVTVTDNNNCMASDSILIKTICNADNYFIPNTFSPNGDGVNDYFYPRGKSLYNIQSLTVFNRWGQMVFQRRDFPANAATMGWDGNFNGRPAPADAYVYVAEVICENGQVVELHGSVTLIR